MPDWNRLAKFSPSETIPRGAVPRRWLQNRSSQSATVKGSFVDISHSSWIASFRSSNWWIDQKIIYSAERENTKLMSYVVHEKPEGYTGIVFGSRHGYDFQNWAIFEERLDASCGPVQAFEENNPDFQEACNLLGIALPTQKSAGNTA